MSSYLVYKEWSDGADDEVIGSANRGARGCSRVCQGGWDVAGSDGEFDGKSTLRNDPFLQLWELPGFIKAGVDYLKIQGAFPFRLALLDGIDDPEEMVRMAER